MGNCCPKNSKNKEASIRTSGGDQRVNVQDHQFSDQLSVKALKAKIARVLSCPLIHQQAVRTKNNLTTLEDSSLSIDPSASSENKNKLTPLGDSSFIWSTPPSKSVRQDCTSPEARLEAGQEGKSADIVQNISMLLVTKRVEDIMLFSKSNLELVNLRYGTPAEQFWDSHLEFQPEEHCIRIQSFLMSGPVIVSQFRGLNASNIIRGIKYQFKSTFARDLTFR
uniref:Uncharacterized protein n=1 Tax=Ditylenchus dipsaci TaxID=166011 RepID=A0A915E5M8_9BILA